MAVFLAVITVWKRTGLNSYVVVIQFQSGVFLVTEVGRMHLIPSAIAVVFLYVCLILPVSFVVWTHEHITAGLTACQESAQ